VGGSFTEYKGATGQNRIIKLNTDGTKDASFDNSTGFNNAVNNITLDSAGKLYVVGFFTSYKGVTANRIIKLNTDGTKDASFDNSTGFGSGGADAKTIAIDSTGKLYVGGNFSNYKGVTASGIIKLNTDGTKDTSFNNSNAFGGEVMKITLDSAGKLYVGGTFSFYKGANANRIIKLNTDGTKDASFDNSIGFDAQVNDITLDSAGKLYVGGTFELYKSVATKRIIKLNTDGSKDTSFDGSTGFDNGGVITIAIA
jgi:uncharacterized delta-60 repeat protein